MKSVGDDANGMTVRMSQTDVSLVRAIGAGSRLTGIPEQEYEERLGRSKWETDEFLEAFGRAVQNWHLSPWIKPSRPVDPRGVEFHLTVDDLKLVRAGLIELTRETEDDDPEFQTLFGTTVGEGRRLLGEIEDLIERGSLGP